MKQHIAKVAAACFYHIRRLHQIRHRVGQAVTTRLVLATIMSRLDYCSPVLAGLLQHTLGPLQKVQNSAARLIFNLSRHDHISPSLIQLHWLPVRARIQYKLCSLMYSVHSSLTVVRRTSLTSFNPPRRRQRVDVYGQLKQPTTFSRGCVPSSLSEVSLTPVQPHGTACRSQSAEHHPRQPSNDNSKHFYFVTLLILLYDHL